MWVVLGIGKIIFVLSDVAVTVMRRVMLFLLVVGGEDDGEVEAASQQGRVRWEKEGLHDLWVVGVGIATKGRW